MEGSGEGTETRRKPNIDEPIRVADAWGIDRELWDRNWSNLSGGEAQRIALASAVGLGTAEILLLDGLSDTWILSCSFPTESCVYHRAYLRFRCPINRKRGEVYRGPSQIPQWAAESHSMDNPFGGARTASGD